MFLKAVKIQNTFFSIGLWNYSRVQTILLFLFKWKAPEELANFISYLLVSTTLNFFFSFQIIVEFPPPLNSLVSIVKGEKWRHIRNTLSPSFSALKMKRMVPLMNQACDTFMSKLEEVADHEESVDIHE